MNPFELQAQFARQWLDLVQTMTKTAVNACASMNEQTAGLWRRSMPWTATAAPYQAAPFPFPWLSGAAPFGMPTPTMPFAATNSWKANPFAPWLSMLTGNTTGFPGMPGMSAFPVIPMMPFAPAMPQMWMPWASMPALTAPPWTGLFGTPQRDPGAEFIEQMATNYRTASGYAVAAVIGPLNAALDPRTYGEPWWQKLEKTKKLN